MRSHGVKSKDEGDQTRRSNSPGFNRLQMTQKTSREGSCDNRNEINDSVEEH
jgi:hypothetical protein